MDRVTQEISVRFQQICKLSERYDFLSPSNLLNDDYECLINEEIDDIDREEFLVERKRLKHFIAAAYEEKEWKGGPLELLEFILTYDLLNSVPNIVIMLRIFLIVAVGVATCERSFSKLKLIKNYLRSTMSHL